jgi:hypothetical protein
MSRVWGVPAITAVMLTVACGLPHDPADTLNHVRHGTLRVGVVNNPPWVVDEGAQVTGVEGRLVAILAAALDARVEWVREPEFGLMRTLKDRDLALVIAGFDENVPWAKSVALTRPYVESPPGTAHVLALPPGENAWLLFVERQLEAHQGEVDDWLGARRP